ncbi:hypothetical protein HanPI659440_Chr13g0513721 [Helianthus annuus]|nr:hypothetical protein HanPI659440_Chr13g0513721 [Helianthus annuus]
MAVYSKTNNKTAQNTLSTTSPTLYGLSTATTDFIWDDKLPLNYHHLVDEYLVNYEP